MAACDDETGAPSFSYRGDLSKPLDLVRFMLGDTKPPGTFSNSEILSALALQPLPNFAAAALAEAQATRVLAMPRVKIGTTEVDPAGQSAGWLAMAARLRDLDDKLTPGDGFADMDDPGACTEQRPAQFAVGMTDAPGNGFGPSGWVGGAYRDPRRGF